MEKLLVICGPTATGKTALALRLASQFHGELISADSRQIYKGMDIGTGKDIGKNPALGAILKTKHGNKQIVLRSYIVQHIPLWFYDVVYPNEEFSVSHYQTCARRIINDIISRGKLPILVGGTGLYIQSIIEPFNTIEIPPDVDLRKELSEASTEQLQRNVKRSLPAVWEKLNESDRNNPRRLIRKLEIGKHASIKSPLPKSAQYDYLMIGLKAENGILYSRIDSRVDERLKAGIIDEVSGLRKSGCSWSLPSMSGLGYREWKDYFEGHLKDKETLKQQIIQQWKFDEHGFARRQLTWFKKISSIHWFDIKQTSYLADVTASVRQWYTLHST